MSQTYFQTNLGREVNANICKVFQSVCNISTYLCCKGGCVEAGLDSGIQAELSTTQGLF